MGGCHCGKYGLFPAKGLSSGLASNVRGYSYRCLVGMGMQIFRRGQGKYPDIRW